MKSYKEWMNDKNSLANEKMSKVDEYSSDIVDDIQKQNRFRLQFIVLKKLNNQYAELMDTHKGTEDENEHIMNYRKAVKIMDGLSFADLGKIYDVWNKMNDKQDSMGAEIIDGEAYIGDVILMWNNKQLK